MPAEGSGHTISTIPWPRIDLQQSAQHHQRCLILAHPSPRPRDLPRPIGLFRARRWLGTYLSLFPCRGWPTQFIFLPCPRDSTPGYLNIDHPCDATSRYEFLFRASRPDISSLRLNVPLSSSPARCGRTKSLVVEVVGADGTVDDVPATTLIPLTPRASSAVDLRLACHHPRMGGRHLLDLSTPDP